MRFRHSVTSRVLRSFFFSVAVFWGALYVAGAEPLIWNFDDGFEGWAPGNWEQVEVVDGQVRGTTKYDCQLLSPKLDIRAEDYAELVVRLRTSLSGNGETFFAAPGERMSDDRKARHTVVAGPDFRTYRISMSAARGDWSGPVERLRFDALNPAGAEVDIDFIALLPVAGTMLINGGVEIGGDAELYEWHRSEAQPGAAVVITPGAESEQALRVMPGGYWETLSLDMSFLGELAVTGVVRSPTGGAVASLRFMDLEGALLTETRRELPQCADWSPFEVTLTCPRMAASAVLRLGTASAGAADFDELQIRRVSDGAIRATPPPKPTWHAAWIWHPDALKQDHVRIFVRHRFTLPETAPVKAVLQSTVDDAYALSVNGREVIRTFGEADGWRTPEKTDLSAVLRPGENVIEIEAEDVSSAQGVIAEMVLEWEDGEIRVIGTGPGWECALSADGPWVQAAVIGRPPCMPWGDLPYELLTPSVPVSLRLSGLPARLPAGDPLALTVSAEALADVVYPVFVRATLSGAGDVLRTAWAPKVLFAAGMPSGARTRIEDWRIPLPFDTSGGDMTVSLELLGGTIPGGAPTATVTVPPRNLPSQYPHAEVVVTDGVGRVHVNGREVDPTQALFTAPDALQIANAARAGVPVWGVALHEMGFFEDGFDYTKTDELLRTYLEAKPDAWLILNFVFDTRYHTWWLREHPEARCRLEDGSDIIGDYHGNRRMVPSIASPVWRDMYTDVLRRLIRHLAATPFAGRIIGFQPCGGITWEWFHWGAQSAELVDYSDAGQADFRRWLTDTYGDDAGLRRAWRRNDVSLETATIPSDAARRSPDHGIFFDPATQQDVLDYNRYQHDVVADTIRHFARVIKEETGGNSLAGTYYGYTIHLPETPGFCQGSGHFSLYRALAAPEIDYFVAPVAYAWREVTGTAATMVPSASMLLNGKLFWNQADLRTHWAQVTGYGKPDTVTGSVACMRRELARNLAAGTAIQWYDFSKGWTFGDDRLSAEVGRLMHAGQAVRGDSRTLPRSERIAVVVDERQMGTFDPFRPPYGLSLIYRFREQLARSGVAHDFYLFSDVLSHPELLEHRLFVMLNLFKLTDEQADFLEGRIMSDGRTVLFFGPVGLLTPDGFDVAVTSRLLGMPMEETSEEIPLRCRVSTEAEFPWSDLAGVEFGVSRAYPPIVIPRSVRGTVLGYFPDREVAALVLLKRPGCTVLWSAAPGFPPAGVRALAAEAGISVFTDRDEATYAGTNVVGVHSRSQGSVPVYLPAGVAEDVLTGRTWEVSGEKRRIDLPMTPGDTVILHTRRQQKEDR